MRHESSESGIARIFLNFSSSSPVLRLAEIFSRLFTSRLGFALTISVAAVFLAVGLALVFFDFGALLSPDEAKHLHIVHALERGEAPYRDFLANHPALFHLFLLWLKRLFGLTDAGHVYLLSKAFVFLHIIAGIALTAWLLCRFCRREFGAARLGLVFIVALPLLGIWGINEFWHVRPDWVALFYAWLAVSAHLIMLQKTVQGQEYSGWLILGAVSFGLGAAVSPKVAHVMVPYAMTLCLAPLLAPRDWRKIFFSRLNALFFINFVFAALSLLFFAGFVTLELWVSGAELGDYIRANYALNSIKHPLITNWDYNPFDAMRRILDLPAPLAYVLAMCVFPLFLALHDREKHLLQRLIVFVGLTIAFNASFPAWTNGVLSAQTFIPSAAATALFISVLILCLLHYAAPGPRLTNRPKQNPGAVQGVAALQLAAALIVLLYMAATSAYHILERGRSADHHRLQRQQIAGGGAFFAPDALMPSDLKYLTFHPQAKPAAAPVWGYFFYSMDRREFWRSARNLGFAPDPADHWRSLYEKSPPDALAVSGPEELKERIGEAQFQQGVDAGWLLERAKRDYACITRGRPFYVRNDLAQAYLRKGGWRLCDNGN